MFPNDSRPSPLLRIKLVLILLSLLLVTFLTPGAGATTSETDQRGVALVVTATVVEPEHRESSAASAAGLSDICGNGLREASEDCDDGNLENGDCCNSNCEFEPGCCMILLPGDINNDGTTSSADIIYSVNFVFKAGWPPIPCMGLLDVNCSGAFTSADILFLVEYMFKSGPAPCDVCSDSPMASDCIA